MKKNSFKTPLLVVLLIMAFGYIVFSAKYELNVTPSGTTFLRTKATDEMKLIYQNPKDNEPLQVLEIPREQISTFADGTQAITQYTSANAKIRLSFKQPMFVQETSQKTDNGAGGFENGKIKITLLKPNPERAGGSLDIDYMRPYIYEQGIYNCSYNDPAIHTVTQKIKGVEISVCEQSLYLITDFIKNPDADIRYKFATAADSAKDFAVYKDIMYSGVTFTK